MRTIRTLIVAAVAAVLVACAGTPFSWDAARQIRPGMTEAELTQLMGPPYLVKSTADGLLWVWSYANAMGGARSVSVQLKNGVVVSAPAVPNSF